MNNRKTAIRFFTIADYEEEEVWLHNQHKNGWKLSRMIPPCFFIFEKCTPEDVAYRLDYKNNSETSNYFQICYHTACGGTNDNESLNFIFPYRLNCCILISETPAYYRARCNAWRSRARKFISCRHPSCTNDWRF